MDFNDGFSGVNLSVCVDGGQFSLQLIEGYEFIAHVCGGDLEELRDCLREGGRLTCEVDSDYTAEFESRCNTFLPSGVQFYKMGEPVGKIDVDYSAIFEYLESL